MLLKTYEVHINSAATDEEMDKVLARLEDLDFDSIVKNFLPDNLAKLIV